MDVDDLTAALAALKDLDADDLNGTQWDKVQAKITEVTEAIEKATTDNELNKAKADALAILETNTAEGGKWESWNAGIIAGVKAWIEEQTETTNLTEDYMGASVATPIYNAQETAKAAVASALSAYDSKQFAGSDYAKFQKIADDTVDAINNASSVEAAEAADDTIVADLSEAALEVAAAKLGDTVTLAKGTEVTRQKIADKVNKVLGTDAGAYAGINQVINTDVVITDRYADYSIATITLTSSTDAATLNVTVTVNVAK